MELQAPLIEESTPKWRQSFYNYFLIVTIPITLLTVFIAPIQILSRYIQADIYALSVLAFAMGIGWHQGFDLLRLYRGNPNSAKNGSHLQFIFIVSYKLISVILAIAAGNYALDLIHLTCPLNAPFKPIRNCFTSPCSYLYISSTACYYWYIAIPTIEISMTIFTKFAHTVPEPLQLPS